ncbi:lysosomal-trafficking regulator-like protein [Dinothrombium tinctorium]|uniref:Lysosomal-trafficking regulator-like protein n=1 Tax=Dinothrombium tinctorium TaxID=1965070 RepID=A0A3S3PRM1_9ACAR|nr:lysosomal-trafficking regulator-like protein [Dinothrombium tinctorium]
MERSNQIPNNHQVGSMKSDYFFNLFHLSELNLNIEPSILSFADTASTSSVLSPDYLNMDGNEFEDEKIIRLSEGELAERLQYLMIKSTDFIVLNHFEKNNDKTEELYFGRTFLHFLVTNFDLIIKHYKNRQSRTFWSSVLSSCKDTVKLSLIKCLTFALSEVETLEEASFLGRFLCQHSSTVKNMVKFCQKSLLPLEAFLLDLNAFEISIEEKQCIKEILQSIENIRSKKRVYLRNFKEVISEWFDDLHRERQLKSRSNIENEQKIAARLDELISSVTETAMSVTRDFVEAQNKERKQFFNHIKQTNSFNYAIKKAWKLLITTFSHERSVWYYTEAFPQNWELDPTEGPLRIRRKLRRCFLNIDNKFFQKGCEIKERKLLMSYLFEKDKYETDSSAFVDRILTNERIIYTTTCMVITPGDEYPGEVLIGTSCIHFVGEQKTASNSCVITEVWMFEDIKEINRRRYQLQNNAIEMFLTNGLTFLIAFDTKDICEDFLNALFTRNLPNLVNEKSLLEMTQLWRERRITNFEYLTFLNKVAGRSFNDLMQYPVFPFVLSDYDSQTLDLENQGSFRKLNRPMAVQKKSKEEYYINQYNYLKAEYESTCHLGELMLPTTGPYHYGSHYSNSGTVLHFLVRLPPFTQMFLQYQDNSFDLPDRTFHSLSTSWRLSSGDSTTDFKELVPEFFFLPEFLTNFQKFNFGIRQNNAVVDDVNLSNWCRNDPRLFILIHRQALESDYVTEHLNEWIDLVFGYKQSGKAAIEAINVFHPATYYGVDASKIKDPLKRKALQTMTKTFGQMPKQLFFSSHLNVYPKTHGRMQRSSEVFPQVIGEVNGLKWGTYVFSPSEPEPLVVCRKNGYSKIAALIPLVTNDVFGISKNSCLMLKYNKHKGGALLNTTCFTNAVITWNHCDGIFRIKYQRDGPLIPFIPEKTLDKVSICCSVPDCNVLLVGYRSGSMVAYSFKEALKMGEVPKYETYCLHGHNGSIDVICMNKEFMIAISGGSDGRCLMWDLNKFCYVRTITKHDDPIKLLAISPTLGDIVSVSDLDEGSALKVNTINGITVGHVKTGEKIEALCYSTAPEGVSVNVIATGFSNGNIQLWSSWDLTAVRLISADRYTKPIKW